MQSYSTCCVSFMKLVIIFLYNYSLVPLKNNVFLLFILRPLQPFIYSTSLGRSRMIFPSPSCITTEKFSKSFICVCFQLRFETICRESDLGKIFLFILFNIKKILSFNYSINCILISISAYRMLILQLMLQKPNLKKKQSTPAISDQKLPNLHFTVVIQFEIVHASLSVTDCFLV